MARGKWCSSCINFDEVDLRTHSKSLFTRHGINKEILSCFLEKRSIVLQRAVITIQFSYTTPPSLGSRKRPVQTEN